MPGQVRFAAKKVGKVWEVYDRYLGAHPVEIPGFGRVQGPFREEDACTDEANRLSEHYSRRGTEMQKYGIG